MNGTLVVRSFEMFVLPVKVFSAIEDTTPKTHEVHGECKTQINRVPRCAKCDVQINQEDIVKGYVIPGSDGLAFLSEEETESLNDVSKTIEILEFAPLSEF